MKATTHETHQSYNAVIDLTCTFEKKHPSLTEAHITVPAALVRALYNEASLAQQAVTEAYGFSKGNVPLDYIQKNFKQTLLEHVEEFLFKYAVTDLLYREIHANKLLLASEPRLTEITVSPHDNAHYYFDLSLFQAPIIQEWKYLPFRAPKRKNYKDLDRQVASFIQAEKELFESIPEKTIMTGDWVNFTVTLVSRNNLTVLGPHTASFWLKIGKEEADASFRELFSGKKVGETFATDCQALQDYFSECIDTSYLFSITINNVVSSTYFCLEKFKRQFKIKTKKGLNQKIVEVFSYRNDISQRRAMVQEAINLLLSKYHFVIPSYIVLRQQKNILEFIQDKPDYHVYRTQKDFDQRVEQLAEKQAREMLFLDHLAHHEKMSVTDLDIAYYLNLTNRPRIKDFIYFDPPCTKLRGQEMPLIEEELKPYCLREKMINYIIYHLTKK